MGDASERNRRASGVGVALCCGCGGVLTGQGWAIEETIAGQSTRAPEDKHNVQSINAEASCNWGPRGLGYYLAARLMWGLPAERCGLAWKSCVRLIRRSKGELEFVPAWSLTQRGPLV